MAIEPMLQAHAAPPPPGGRSPLWSVVLAVCLPLAACPVGSTVFVASVGRGEVMQTIAEGGAAAWVVLLTLAMGSVIAAICLGFMARGIRVPAAVPLVFAVLPWLVGDAGLRVGLKKITEALGSVDPADKATLLAAGLAEASVNRSMGSLFSAVLLACVGLGLAIAATGRSRSPSAAGLVVGLIAAGPLLGAALLVPSLRENGLLGFLPVLPALIAVLALPIAARAASADGPRASSAALAAGVGAPVGIAFVAASVAACITLLFQGMRALAMVSPADKVTVALAVIAEVKPLVLLTTWGWALAAVPLLAVGGWSLMRGSAVRAPAGTVLGGAVVLGLVAAVDLSASRAMNDATSSIAPRPWADVPGFQAARFSGGSFGSGSDAIVLPDRIVFETGAALERPFESPEALAASFAERVHEPEFVQVRLRLAVDARVRPEQLKLLLDAIVKSRASTLQLTGEAERPLTPPGASPYDPTAWLPKLLDGPSTVQLDLQPRDPGPGRERREMAVGPKGLASELDPALGDDSVVVLLLQADATLEGLMTAAAAVTKRHLVASLAVTPPISPPLKDPEPSSLGLGGTRHLETILGDHPGAAEPVTAPLVTGPMDKEAIRRVIQKHRGEARYCFEKQLMVNPKLAGKVAVKFVISATGAVATAIVASSTVGDPGLEGCLTKRVKTWQFPKPKGGGVVQVTYPFIFSAAP